MNTLGMLGFILGVFGLMAYLNISPLKRKIEKLESALSAMEGTTYHEDRESLLKAAAGYIGKSVTRVDTYRVKASQYNPLDGSFKKKELRDRMIELDEGVIVQRDLLSAYCILHTSETNDSIDAKAAYKNFDTFKQHNDAEIRRLRNERKLTWYTA